MKDIWNRNKTKYSAFEVNEMRRFEREVVDYKLIEAMLQEMTIVNVGMNGEDGFLMLYQWVLALKWRIYTWMCIHILWK